MCHLMYEVEYMRLLVGSKGLWFKYEQDLFWVSTIFQDYLNYQ